ncbi:MAG: LDCC motif putative metal-binding protein [Spirochaetaceae bacterium]|jgi:hypothetical protein|nr:LDCC motif putative metal-binding protein [Spirochaetaceae bacterium]
MEEYTGIAHYDFRTKPDRGSVDRLIEKLLNDNNIVDVNTGENSISIEYYQQLTSREKLQTLIENAGIELKIQESDSEIIYEKNPFKRFINRMAASNEKRFGNKRLDCCDLHNEKD